MNIQGKIVEIFETQQINERFTKREFVIEFSENPSYVEYIKLEFNQDKCRILDNYKLDEVVDVYFNLKGRPHVNKQGQKIYHNTLQAWRITHFDPNALPAPATSEQQQQNPPQDKKSPNDPYANDARFTNNDSDDDDLPF